MLKKILTTIYLLTLTTTPVQSAPYWSAPYWAVEIASSQCRYLAMGLDWETAIDQSLRDNRFWIEEMTIHSETSARAIVFAAHQICPNLYRRSFQEHKKDSLFEKTQLPL